MTETLYYCRACRRGFLSGHAFAGHKPHCGQGRGQLKQPVEMPSPEPEMIIRPVCTCHEGLCDYHEGDAW